MPFVPRPEAGRSSTATERRVGVSVVVPSRGRPQRLRSLLDALYEQTLPPDRFEVIVVHDRDDAGTQRVLSSHPLGRDGQLRAIPAPERAWRSGSRRNLGWRAATAPLIAFTDDDCRPTDRWLEVVLQAAGRNPGAVVQGMTLEDPDELANARAAFSRSRRVIPPTPWAEMCNIVYPRDVLDRIGGIDERLSTFEDTDAALRAREAGVTVAADRGALVYHAVLTPSFLETLRSVARWRDAPAAVKRHPGLRRHMPGRIFWKQTHLWLPAAALGLILGARGRRWALVLCLPWARHAMPHYGPSLRGRTRALLELPICGLLDLGEIGVLAASSLRHRSLLL